MLVRKSLTKAVVFMLSLVLVLSCCSTFGVFAATAKTGILNISEDFEDISSYTMCNQMGSNITNTYSYSVVEGGRDGGKAMLFMADTTHHYHRIGFAVNQTSSADNIFDVSYDIRMSKFPTAITDSSGGNANTSDVAFMDFGGSPSGGSPVGYQFVRKTVDDVVQVWLQYNTVDVKQISTDDWFRVKWFQNGTGTTAYTEIYSEDGTLLHSSSGGFNSTGGYDACFVMGGYYNRCSDAELLIDNVKVNNYSKATYGPSVVSSNVINGATDVSLRTTSVAVELDQPLSTMAATLTPAGGEAVDCTVALKGGTYRTYEISWSDKLTAQTAYTLDLTGSQNSNDVAVDSTGIITFTSGNPTKEDSMTYEDFDDLSGISLKRQFDANETTANFSVVDGGRGAGKALQFLGSYQYYRLGIKRPDNAAAETISEASYDLRLSKLPTRVYDYSDADKTGDVAFMIFQGSVSGGTPKPLQLIRKMTGDAVSVWLSDGTQDIVQLTTNDWIHVKWFMTGNGDGPSYIEIYNAAGTLLYSTRRSWDYPQCYMIGTPYGTCSDAEILLDNMYFNSYSQKDYGPSVVQSSVENGAEDVPLYTKSITVELDQPLSAMSATLTPAGGEAVDCTVALKRDTYRTYDITWSDNLTGTTQYTLDLTGSKNASDVAVDETGVITFTTLDPARDPVAFTGATFSGGEVFANAATGVDIKETFTLNFDRAIGTPVANETILLYLDGDDAKTPISVALKLSDDRTSVKVTPSAALKLNTSYVLDFSAVKSESEGILSSDIKTLTFKTIEKRDAIYATDDFEGYSHGTLGSALNSAVLANSDDSKIIVTVEDGAGYGGSKGIHAVITNTNPSTNGGVVLKPYDLADGEYLYCEYKIKINANNPAASNGIAVGGINGWEWSTALGRAGSYKNETGIDAHYIQPWSAGSRWFTYDLGTWFNVVLKIGATDQSFYMMDEAGRLLLSYDYTRTLTGDLVTVLAGASWTTADVCIDDVKVFRTSSHALALADTPTYDGEAITVAFNEPLTWTPAHDSADTPDAATNLMLYDDSEQVAAKVIRAGMSTVLIIPERPLRENHTYTVTYPQQTSVSAKTLAAGSITFTTAKAFNVKAVAANLSISGGTTSAGDVSITLYNAGSAVSGAVAVVALYDEGRPDRLVGLEMANTTVAQGESNITVTLDQSYSDVDYAVVMLYDASYTQLMQGLRID